MRARLADYLNCQRAFVSQVLAEKQHFTGEMALQTGQFLKLGDLELDYLMLLYHCNRAATQDLKKFYLKKMQGIQKKRKEIKSRLREKNPILEAAMMEFYSSPLYSLILLMATIPSYQKKEAMADRLAISLKELNPLIDFLESQGLISVKANEIYGTKRQIHIDRSSPLLLNYHGQWRMNAMRDVYKKNPEHMHFSSQFTLNKKDFQKIKDLLLSTIETVDDRIENTKDMDEVYALNLDLFKV